MSLIWGEIHDKDRVHVDSQKKKKKKKKTHRLKCDIEESKRIKTEFWLIIKL